MTLRPVVVERDVSARMRDGAVLRSDVYRPESDDGPVLVIRTPYDKSLLNPRFFDPIKAASAHGYVVVVQDTRGRCRSDGDWYPFVHEADDGYDTVEWAAALPYSTGAVGLLGPSYLGFCALAAASRQPPALRAISATVTQIGPANGCVSRGGAFELGLQAGWHALMGINFLARRRSHDPTARLDELLAGFDELDEHYAHSPISEFPLLAETGAAPAFFDTLAEYEAGGGPITEAVTIDTDRLSVPVQCIGGWFDIYLADTLALFQALEQRTVPANLIVGPWTHQVPPLVARIGDRALPLNAMAIGNDLTRAETVCDAQITWFDRWLKPSDRAPACAGRALVHLRRESMAQRRELAARQPDHDAVPELGRTVDVRPAD